MAEKNKTLQDHLQELEIGDTLKHNGKEFTKLTSKQILIAQGSAMVVMELYNQATNDKLNLRTVPAPAAPIAPAAGKK